MHAKYRIRILALAAIWTVFAGTSVAAEPLGAGDIVPGTPFHEGDVVAFDQVDVLEDYLPPPFWENRVFFFFEGMALEIGPFFRKYGESDAYRKVTRENRGKASIGPDGSLASHTGGLPFRTDRIDCGGDPEAGAKIIWRG